MWSRVSSDYCFVPIMPELIKISGLKSERSTHSLTQQLEVSAKLYPMRGVLRPVSEVHEI
jgi:hypothetical protein